jgi:peroxiredoxin
MSTPVTPESKPSLRPLIFVLVGMVAVVVALRLLWQEPQPPEGRRVGNLSPEVAGYDPDDKPVKLSDHKGKVVLISFWATWCPPCRKQLPHEREMVTEKYKGRPFAFLGVAQDSPETLQEFAKANPLPWPNIVDDRAILGKAWGVQYLPSAVLIDHKGVIREAWVAGITDHDAVWVAVERLVAEAEQK